VLQIGQVNLAGFVSGEPVAYPETSDITQTRIQVRFMIIPFCPSSYPAVLRQGRGRFAMMVLFQ